MDIKIDEKEFYNVKELNIELFPIEHVGKYTICYEDGYKIKIKCCEEDISTTVEITKYTKPKIEIT